MVVNPDASQNNNLKKKIGKKKKKKAKKIRPKKLRKKYMNTIKTYENSVIEIHKDIEKHMKSWRKIKRPTLHQVGLSEIEAANYGGGSVIR